MATWIVTYRERTHFTKIKDEEIESVLVKESIKWDLDDTF